jgi:hypothetical protein
LALQIKVRAIYPSEASRHNPGPWHFTCADDEAARSTVIALAAGTFVLDPTTTKIWDHRSNESRKKGGDTLGIYELDGDKLKVGCVNGIWKDKQWPGNPRPTESKLRAADVVLELRRVKANR